MIQLVIGAKQKPHQTQQLIIAVRDGLPDWTGTLFVGYPILATPDERTTIDALLLAEGRAPVIFDVVESVPGAAAAEEFWEERETHQASLYNRLHSKLMLTPELTKKRGLAFEPAVVTFAPPGTVANAEDLIVATPLDFAAVMAEAVPTIESRYTMPLAAAIERVTNLKPKNKRSNVVRSDSRGAVIKTIEKEIANLDQWQKAAAIESPEGPQRIRGLAGSGKTIVLALKAA